MSENTLQQHLSHHGMQYILDENGVRYKKTHVVTDISNSNGFYQISCYFHLPRHLGQEKPPYEMWLEREGVIRSKVPEKSAEVVVVGRRFIEEPRGQYHYNPDNMELFLKTANEQIFDAVANGTTDFALRDSVVCQCEQVGNDLQIKNFQMSGDEEVPFMTQIRKTLEWACNVMGGLNSITLNKKGTMEKVSSQYSSPDEKSLVSMIGDRLGSAKVAKYLGLSSDPQNAVSRFLSRNKNDKYYRNVEELITGFSAPDYRTVKCLDRVLPVGACKTKTDGSDHSEMDM